MTGQQPPTIIWIAQREPAPVREWGEADGALPLPVAEEADVQSRCEDAPRVVRVKVQIPEGKEVGKESSLLSHAWCCVPKSKRMRRDNG